MRTFWFRGVKERMLSDSKHPGAPWWETLQNFSQTWELVGLLEELCWRSTRGFEVWRELRQSSCASRRRCSSRRSRTCLSVYLQKTKKKVKAANFHNPETELFRLITSNCVKNGLRSTSIPLFASWASKDIGGGFSLN